MDRARALPGNEAATSPDHAPGSAASRWLLPIGLFLLAGAIRIIVWPSVFVGGHVMVVGNDTYYHLRRILYACANFPGSVGFDPFLNFPDGARAIWPPFLDVAIAGLVRLLSAGSAEDVERIAIWVPPALGAGAVLGVFLLVRRHFGAAGGAAAALALCFTPVHVWYSQLSFVDHHVAVALVAVGLFAVVLALSASLGGAAAVRRERNLALAAGLLLSLGIHVWTGFLLHQVILLVPALLALLVIEERSRARRVTTALAWIHAVPLVAVAPFGLGQEWSQSEVASFTPIALSNFHPWFFSVLTIFFVACTWLYGRAAGDTRLRRTGTALGVGTLCLASIVPLLAGIAGGIEDSLDFFLKSQPSMGQVAESLTILRFGGQKEPSLLPALRFASGLFLLGPLCGLAVLLAARDAETRVRAGLILWWTVAWTGCALVQSRLANSLSVANAIAFGAAVQLALTWLAGRGLGRAARFGTATALLALALWPSLPSIRAAFQAPVRALRGEAPLLDAHQRRLRLVLSTGRWLRDNSPAVEGYLDTTRKPAYGFLSTTNIGHQLLWASQRPALLGAFADYAGPENFALLLALPGMSEAEASAMLARKRARYLILGAAEPSGDPASMGHLLRNDPYPSQRRPAAGAPALTRLRLVYMSDPLWPERPAALPYMRVFEHVAGAEVTGRAPAGSTVSLRVSLVDGRHGRWIHAVSAQTDPSGRYRVRVPYATTAPNGALLAEGPYELRCGSGTAKFDVDERAVAEGEVIAVPDCGAVPSDAGRAEPSAE